MCTLFVTLYVHTCILGEANVQRRFCDFLLEDVCLVEEEDDGGAAKELVVGDAIEQVQALMHAVL